MARTASNVLRIIIEGDSSGAVGAVDSLNDSLKDAAKGWAAYEGINFLKGVTEEASSLLESQNKVDQVFGDSAAAVRSFGEQAASALGQSEQAVNQATGTYGNLLQAFGLSQDTAAEMSTTLVKLASDLAAFNDVPVEEVITSLRASISGEIEPARRLGINLLDVRLKSIAMAEGLYDGSGALDAAAKAQAAYIAILEDTRIAQGQFDRESEGLLAQQMMARAEWENSRAELGMKFIPAMIAATKAASGLGGAFAAVPGPIQVGALAMTGWLLVGSKAVAVGSRLGGAVGNLGSAYPALSSALRNNVANLSANTIAMSSAAAGVIAYTVAYEGLQAIVEAQSVGADVERLNAALLNLAETGEARNALSAYGDDWEKLATRISQVEGFYRQNTNSMTQFAGAAFAGYITEGAGGTTLKAAQDDIEELDKALADLFAQDPEAATTAYGQISSALLRQGVSAEDVGRSFDDYNNAVDDSTLATGEATDATEENTDAVREQSKILDEANKRFEDRVSRFERIRSATERVRNAEEANADAVLEVADAQRAAAGDSDEYRDAKEAEADALKGVQDALKGVRDAEEGVAEAQQRVQEAQRNLNDARVEAREKIEDLARAARDAVLDEAQANLNVRKAYEDLQRILGSGASQTEKDQARLDYQQAREDAAQAQQDAATAQQDAAAAAAAGVEGDQGVIDAKEQLADANDGVTDALERVQEANEGVAEANRRVQDAERRTAEVGEDANRRLQEAKAASEQATIDLADAQSDLTGAVSGSRAQVQQLRDSLQEIADMFAPGSPEREYYQWLVDQLVILQNGGILGAGAPGMPGGNYQGVGTPQDESRDPVRPRSGVTINYSPTHMGSARRERQLIEQHDRKVIDDFSRRLG